MKKFKLTSNTKVNAFGVRLFQIECTVETKYAKVGDLGGWIEKEDNLSGDARVYGDAEVSGNARVYGDAWVSGNARVSGNADYCCFQSFGSAGRTTTAYRQKDGTIKIACGCFSGNLDEFIAKVKETHGDNQYAREYLAIVEVIKVKFGL